jgi:hypothetical protein
VTAGLERRTDLLLQYILIAAAQEDDWRDRELGPIHFLKYAYLGDLAYAQRRGGESYTGAEWQFYHFGPWQAEIHDRIEPAVAAISAERKVSRSSRSDDFVRFTVQLGPELERLREQIETELPLTVSGAVRAAVHEFGANTAALLRHVYLTTPMISAAPGEKLVLTPLPQTGAQVESTRAGDHDRTASQRKRRKEGLSALKQRVQERLSHRVAVAQHVSPAPRYDAVFAAGTEWLDALSGDPVQDVSGELIVSPDVWKSPTRTEPDVP